MKKRFGGFTLAAILALTGCGATDAGETADAATYRIGILQQVEHGSLDEATRGFEEKLTALLGDAVSFDYKNAQGEQTSCATIAAKFVSDDVDLIMANATSALQAAAAATADIPIVGASVTDYVAAGVVDSNAAPGRNVTGVSDLSEIRAQLDVLLQFCAADTKIAIVYCSSEPNSIYQAELAAAYLEELGRAYAVFTTADSYELQAVLTKAVESCGAMYLPTDNTLANNMEIVKNVTVPAGTVTFAGAERMCRIGALATLSISYYELGAKAGEMAYDILVNGADPATMSVEFVSEGITPQYNVEIAETLGLTMPEGMEAIAAE